MAFGPSAGSWATPLPDLGSADTPHVLSEPPVQYRYNRKLAVALALMLQTGKPGFLVGESGVGKTSAVEHLAARIGCSLTVISCDAHITRADLLGGLRLVPGPDGRSITTFTEGILPRAYARPGILLLDEVDRIEPDLAWSLHTVLTGGPLVLLEDAGRKVVRHPALRIIATANTRGLAHMEEAHRGLAQALSPAFRERFSIWHEIELPPESVEREMLRARAPDLPQQSIDEIIRVAKRVRAKYADRVLSQGCSPRVTLDAVEMLAAINKAAPSKAQAKGNFKAALELAVVGRFTSSEAQIVQALISEVPAIPMSDAEATADAA